MKPSPFKLERFFAKYEHKVPYLLCSSDPESFLLEELLALDPSGHNDFNKCWLGYMEAVGSLTLRTEISKIYNNIVPNETLVHAGAEEVIFVFMSSNLESGDHVIVHFPNYQSFPFPPCPGSGPGVHGADAGFDFLGRFFPVNLAVGFGKFFGVCGQIIVLRF